MTPAAPPPNWAPRRKVVVGAVAGAAVVVLDFLVRQLFHIDQPSETAAAEVVIASTALAYLVPEADQA